MAGQIKKLINEIIEKKSKGNPVLKNTTRTKLLLKGIDPDKFGATTPDDPQILKKVEAMAKELGVKI